jgi:hypothetical protein
MKTDALVDFLAKGAGPAPHATALRRLLPAAAAGIAASAALALVILGPVPSAMLSAPALWIKLAYATLMAISAGWLTARLGRPVSHLASPALAIATVVLAMAALGLMAYLDTPTPGRAAAVAGHSWLTCPWNVLGLSLPALAASLWALRGLAPTRPRRAGFAAGLFAGAMGALGYALGCVEQSTVFIALWYSLGMGLCAVLGAVAAPRLLRW